VARLKVLDLFSGIGGFSLGLERTGGFETVAFCEIDPFCRRVLAERWPGVPCHGDITELRFQEGQADVVTGGFPCQDVSLAGRRAGLSGSRSGLYRELVRAIRVVRPLYGLMENVAALLSDGMGTVLGDLAESGIDTEWDCVPASAIGAPHERDRVWIVAHPDTERRGEAGGIRHRQVEMPSGGAAARPTARDAAYAESEQVGIARQPRLDSGVGATDPDVASIGCGQGRPGRPPDSFARVRDEARRNAADPYGERLVFREGVSRDAWEERQATERNCHEYGGQSIWPDEPALSGVDDGVPDWLDRVRATGNAVVPQIPELIGRAILAAHEPPFRRSATANAAFNTSSAASRSVP